MINNIVICTVDSFYDTIEYGHWTLKINQSSLARVIKNTSQSHVQESKMVSVSFSSLIAHDYSQTDNITL